MIAVIKGKPEGKAVDEEDQKVKIPEKDINIGTSFHCRGGLLTFSFHVRATDRIKCYLFWYVIV